MQVIKNMENGSIEHSDTLSITCGNCGYKNDENRLRRSYLDVVELLVKTRYVELCGRCGMAVRSYK